MTSSDGIWLIFLSVLLGYFVRKKFFLNTGSWLVTQGRIIRFSIEKDRLFPEIEYTYVLFDQVFFGSDFFRNPLLVSVNSASARALAYKAAKAFKEDKDIDVYYNPDNPTESALDASVPAKLNGIVVLLLILMAFQLLIITKRILA